MPQIRGLSRDQVRGTRVIIRWSRQARWRQASLRRNIRVDQQEEHVRLPPITPFSRRCFRTM